MKNSVFLQKRQRRFLPVFLSLSMVAMLTASPGTVAFAAEGGSNTTATSALDVTGDAEFFINGEPGQERTYNETTHMDEVEQKTSITYPYDGNSGVVEFEFSSFINERYTALSINNIDYSSYIPGYTSDADPKTDEQIEAEVLDAIALNGNNQTCTFVLEVPQDDSYTVEVSKKEIHEEDSVYWPVGNFLWTNEEGGDDCIKGGKIEFVSAVYHGKVYTKSDLADLPCYFSWDNMDEHHDSTDEYTGEGGAVFPYGTELTVKLIPDYGKQLVSFGVNGSSFTCGEVVSEYSFTIARGNFHLGASFEDVEDEVTATSSDVTGGKISLGENELDTGSAVLTVADADVSASEQTAFTEAAEGYTVNSFLDLNLNQVVYKGSKEAYWTNEMTTLNSKAEVALSLGTAPADTEVEIIHQKHDGTYEVLPAVYDASAKTVTFTTDSFSKYAVASKTQPVPAPTPAPASPSSGGGSVVPASTGQNQTSEQSSGNQEGTTSNANTGTTDTASDTNTDTSLEETAPAATGTILSDADGEGNYKVVSTSASNPTVQYTGAEKEEQETVIIPATIQDSQGVTYKVTTIAPNAFQGNESLTSVKLGSNIRVIGKNAFADCTSLKTVTVPNRVTSIGSGAFSGCTRLTTVVIGKNVSKIGGNAFKGSKNIKRITIKSTSITAKSLSKNAFAGIGSDTVIKVPSDKVTEYTSLFRKRGLDKKVKIKAY